MRRPAPTYAPAIRGTTNSVTFPIRFTPPITTNPIKNAMPIPAYILLKENVSARETETEFPEP